MLPDGHARGAELRADGAAGDDAAGLAQQFKDSGFHDNNGTAFFVNLSENNS